MKPAIRKDQSAIIKLLEMDHFLSDKQINEICINEARWHYSQHFYSELRGEEVIEDMLSKASSKRVRHILQSQLKDELSHARSYSRVAKDLGIINEAMVFANQYSNLVLQQKTLAEQIFVFQILTESVAHAFISWRIDAITDPSLRAIDLDVLHDENMHLNMGQALLQSVDPEDIENQLSVTNRRQLIRDILDIAQNGFSLAMRHCANLLDVNIALPASHRTELDQRIAKKVLIESRRFFSTTIERLNPS